MNKRLQLSTKARTLHALRPLLSLASVKPVYLSTVGDWLRGSESVVRDISKTFSGKSVIVRSSVTNEDSLSSSCAGRYQSVANVAADSATALHEAINRVVASYQSEDPDNEFFVQEQLHGVKCAGVVFTRDLDTLAPYYVVNYDDHSGLTDSVTAGFSNGLKTYVRFKQSPHPPETEDLKQIIDAAAEVEAIVGNDALDIEFAFTTSQELYVLQVRPIVREAKPQPVQSEIFGSYLEKMHRKIQKLNGPHPGLHGNQAIYSVMTDWNPAEIIGIKPRKLALSLYKELITDAIWAYQRDNYGYKNLRSFPLLVSFMGLPYIDVRASLNSFVPAELDPTLTGKLVDYYIDRLVESPADHDKVEFNIVFSCYNLDLASRLKRLLSHGFTELELDRIKYSLLDLTNTIIAPKDGRYRQDLARVSHLERRFTEITSSSLPLIDKIYWLIEDCKRYGTLPFAGLARAGFIAVQFLKSFVDLQIITAEELDAYMNSLNTVAKQLSSDLCEYRCNQVSREIMEQRYGHLRPGTYDILSRRYDENFDSYFTKTTEPSKDLPRARFEFSEVQRRAIQDRLHENGIHASFDDLMLFIKEAIEGREHSKFIFTRSLSHVLVLLEHLGSRIGLSREEMSSVDIKTVIDQYGSLSHLDLGDILRGDVERNRDAYDVTRLIRLPQLITSESHVYDFHLSRTEPNFITQRRVSELVVLEDEILNQDLSRRIVFIRSADPGYDWLFSRNIGGLVTMYGGANSHMAIRCAELSIPAVIGCGEKNFESWSRSRMLEIDCTNRLVKVPSDLPS